MIVGITSTGNTLESVIDSRFGRCSYFVIYNKETKDISFQPNPYKDVDEGAGVSVVDWICGLSCSKIVSGEFGAKIKPLLDDHKIQMIILKNPQMTINQIIGLLNH